MPKRVRIYCRTDSRSRESAPSSLPSVARRTARLPPGEKELNLGSRTRKSRPYNAKSSAEVSGTCETASRATSYESRCPTQSFGRGVPFSLGTRVTDLENNTKPQLRYALLLSQSVSLPLSLPKHHFVTNEAPNFESDSVSLGGRFLPSPPVPSIPPPFPNSPQD